MHLLSEEDDAIRHQGRVTACAPGGSYSHVSFVRVYATCRLRRIWFTANSSTQQLPQEFQLYGHEAQGDN